MFSKSVTTISFMFFYTTNRHKYAGFLATHNKKVVNKLKDNMALTTGETLVLSTQTYGPSV